MASIEDSGSFDHSSNLCGTKSLSFFHSLLKQPHTHHLSLFIAILGLVKLLPLMLINCFFLLIVMEKRLTIVFVTVLFLKYLCFWLRFFPPKSNET